MSQTRTVDELAQLFETPGVPHAYYSIGRMAGGDCHVLENQDGVWKTYFSERGNRFDETSYASDDEACEAMFALVAETVWFSQHRKLQRQALNEL